MKIKLVVVDLELSRRQKAALATGLGAALIMAAAVAGAEVPNTFAVGETLTAADLNDNFVAIDGDVTALSTDLAALEERQTALEAAPANVATGSSSTEFFTTSTTFVDLPSVSATITTNGGPVLVSVSTNFNALTGDLGTYNSYGSVTVARGSTNLGHPQHGFQVVSAAQQDNAPVAFSFIDTPAAGVHTYALRVRAGEAGVSSQWGEGGQRQTISVAELR